MTRAYETKPLRELCDDFRQDIVDGPFGSELQRRDYVDAGVPVLKIQNVKAFLVELKKMDYVTSAKFEKLQRHSFQRGDIVMTKLGSPLGASAVVQNLDEGLIVADLVRIRARKIDTRYLCYQLNSPRIKGFINSMQKGTTRPRIRLSVVRDLPVECPPAPEQRRIAAILDKAFEAIAKTHENAEKSLRNARALFESYLESALSQGGRGWTGRRLAQAVDANCTLSYGIVQPGEECSGGLPVVRPTDLTTKTVLACGLKRINPKRADSYQRTRLQGGELLLCVRGTTGVVAVASIELAGANVTRGIVPIRFDPTLVSQEFGYYLLRSGAVQRQVREKTYGAALRQINIRDVRDVLVSYPTLSVQATLVAQLDEASMGSARLEANFLRRVAALDELKQSMLHQAFSGEL